MAKKSLNAWEILRISSGLGLLIALPISGGTILGFFLDQKFATKPILTIIFLLAGIFLSFSAVFKRLKEIQN